MRKQNLKAQRIKSNRALKKHNKLAKTKKKRAERLLSKNNAIKNYKTKLIELYKEKLIEQFNQQFNSGNQ